MQQIINNRFIISIHVPTRGTTSVRCYHLTQTDFNPRPYTRDDSSSLISASRCAIFQSTSLHEGRLKIHVYRPRGCISIHVPTRGTTFVSSVIVNNTDISIHVPTRGTTGRMSRFSTIFISIHVPTRGTTNSHVGSYHWNISIHVPTRGTTNFQRNLTRNIRFQSTSLHEGRPMESFKRRS